MNKKEMISQMADDLAYELHMALEAQMHDEAEYLLDNHHDVDELSDDEYLALISEVVAKVHIDHW